MEIIQASKVCTVTPTIDTGIYASGDRLGSIMTLPGAIRVVGKHSYLISCSVLDISKQSSALRIFLFNSLPTIASADQAAYDISDAQAVKCVGWFDILAAAWATDSASNSIATVTGINIGPLVSSDTNGIDLYAVCVSKGTPTYTTTAALTFMFRFLQDT